MSVLTRVQIVTVSTAPTHKYQKLQKQTTKQWGYSYTSIAQGVQWQGFVTKMVQAADYLKKALLEDPSGTRETLYAFVDAYDLVFTGPPEELLAKYRNHDVPIVVGVERICFGNCVPTTCEPVNTSGSVRQFINGGCVIGRADELATFYEWGARHYPADDQIALSQYYSRHCGMIAKDTEAEIVLNLAAFTWKELDTLEMQDGRLTLSKTGTQPCMVHCPFIFQDLGERWDFVLRETLPGYTPPHTTGQLFHSLVKHVTTLAQNNKSYFVFVLVLSYGSVLAVIALVIVCVLAFRAGSKALVMYEHGH